MIHGAYDVSDRLVLLVIWYVINPTPLSSMHASHQQPLFPSRKHFRPESVTFPPTCWNQSLRLSPIQQAKRDPYPKQVIHSFFAYPKHSPRKTQTHHLFWLRGHPERNLASPARHDTNHCRIKPSVGEGRFWVHDLFVFRDPNDDMGLLFAFQLLEIV